MALTLMFAGAPGISQQHPPVPVNPPEEPDAHLPNGKLQRDEILKEDHDKSLHDVAEILKITEELQTNLEKEDYQVLSISSMKKAERIEKLAHAIRSRMRRF